MKAMDEEKSVLRWGGLAGMLAGILFLVTIPLFALIPPPSLPVTPEQLMRYPDIRAALTALFSLIIARDILIVALVLALYLALRRTSLGSALFGSVLAVLGLVVLAIDQASLFIALPVLSDLFANAATTAIETTILLLWEATIGMTFTFFYVGNLFLWIGIIVLGVAMLGTPAFGKGFGGVSVVLGVAGVVGLSFFAFAVDSSSFALVALLALPIFIIFPLLLGWKVHNLSRADSE